LYFWTPFYPTEHTICFHCFIWCFSKRYHSHKAFVFAAIMFLYQMGQAAMVAAAFGGTLPPGVTGTNDRCTLIVSNLNSDVSRDLTCHELPKLFTS
jgi:hypothetical protein